MHTIKLTLLALALACACSPASCATAVETEAGTTGPVPTGTASTDDGGASTDATTTTTTTTGTAVDLGAGSTGERCPPCPGPAECTAHVTPDGVCEDACDVLDLACAASGLSPQDCGLAHWLCSQGGDPCGIAAERGNDQAGRLCACAMGCAPAVGTEAT